MRLVRIISATLVVMILTTILGTYALAAVYPGVYGEARVKYHIITVKTGKGLLPARIDFGFYKGCGNDVDTGKIKTIYSNWTVKVYDKNGKYVKTEYAIGSSGLRINGLKRNTTYTLYVYGPIAPRETLIGHRIKNWSVYPAFYVRSTRNISNMWISGRSIN